MHRRDLKELLDTCPHIYVQVETKGYYSLTIKRMCQICDDESNVAHGWKCDDSPDKICHYYTMVDRDGVRCVDLADGLLDHNFPRTDKEKRWKWDPEYETCLCCLYCGAPEERK